MASVKIPDPLTRRHLLERELSADDALKYAEAYIEAERWVDAVLFLAKANNLDRLEELASQAEEMGDVFLMREIDSVRTEEASRERWQGLAAAADEKGKALYAATARRLAGAGEE